MSASKRARFALAVELIYRVDGVEAAWRFFLRHARTGIRCPACDGKGSIPFTEAEKAMRRPDGRPLFDFGAHDCPLCGCHGAMRPRARPPAALYERQAAQAEAISWGWVDGVYTRGHPWDFDQDPEPTE